MTARRAAGSFPRTQELRGRGARGGEQVPRDEALAARPMQRQQPDQPGDRLRASRMAGKPGKARRGPGIEHQCGELDQRAAVSPQ